MHRGKRVKLGSVALVQGRGRGGAGRGGISRRFADRAEDAAGGPSSSRCRQGCAPTRAQSSPTLARRHEVEILSGDREPAVALVARELGVTRFAFGLKPGDKIARLKALAGAGSAR